MLKIARKLFGRKNAVHVGLDIGLDSVKVVELLRNENKVELNRMGIVELPRSIRMAGDGDSADPEQVAACIRNLLAVTGVVCRDVTVAISGKKVFFRDISLPNMNDRELREAVKWEIDYCVPYANGTYFYDFAVLDTDEHKAETRVFVVASLKEHVEAIEKICTLTGLNIVAVEFEPLAMKRTFEQEDNIVVVDICEFLSQVILYQAAVPVFVRTIPVGSGNFEEALLRDSNLKISEISRHAHLSATAKADTALIPPHLFNTLRDFCQEIHRTLEYYQIQNQQVVIDNFYLSGCTERINKFKSFISDLLGKPVVAHNSLCQFCLHSTYDQEYLQREGPRMTVAAGLALRGLDND